jgi:hypothetical protein
MPIAMGTAMSAMPYTLSTMSSTVVRSPDAKFVVYFMNSNRPAKKSGGILLVWILFMPTDNEK